MAEITGELLYATYNLQVQVPVLRIGRPAGAEGTGPMVTVAERVDVAGMLTYYEQFLWERPGEVTREQFQAMLEDYVRLAILREVGVETTPLIVSEDEAMSNEQ